MASSPAARNRTGSSPTRTNSKRVAIASSASVIFCTEGTYGFEGEDEILKTLLERSSDRDRMKIFAPDQITDRIKKVVNISALHDERGWIQRASHMRRGMRFRAEKDHRDGIE